MKHEFSHITLAHGNGGRFMRELIEDLFAQHLSNPLLNTDSDAARLPALEGELLITTDGFTVQPLEFPGGSIGSLAIHGTVNDLAVSGAKPRYLTLNAFIEEGLDIATLERLIADMAQAANKAGVSIVAGDTKVLKRGEGGGVYFATTGVGVKTTTLELSMQHIQAGDKLLVSGPVGDHGTAVMLAREQFGLSGDLQSDSANVIALCQSALQLPGLRFMRDPTRGGLATVAQEICRTTQQQVLLDGPSIPIQDPVQSVCDMLGYDPLYLACEGRVVAVVSPEQADALLAAWQQHTAGAQAAIIGEIQSNARPQVILQTELGGQRLLDELEDDPLPRIC